MDYSNTRYVNGRRTQNGNVRDPRDDYRRRPIEEREDKINRARNNSVSSRKKDIIEVKYRGSRFKISAHRLKVAVVTSFLATAIARLMTNTFYEPYIIYKYGFNIKFKKYVITYIIYAVLMVISSIFMYFLCKIINVNLFINILLKLILCITIHTSLIVLIYHQTDEYKYVVSILYMILKNIYKKVCFLKKI